MFRQGDILIVRAKPTAILWTVGKETTELTIPRTAGAAQSAADRHRLVGRLQRLHGGMPETGVAAFEVRGEPARLEHPEHGVLEIPQGVYIALRQRTYTGGGSALVID